MPAGLGTVGASSFSIQRSLRKASGCWVGGFSATSDAGQGDHHLITLFPDCSPGGADAIAECHPDHSDAVDLEAFPTKVAEVNCGRSSRPMTPASSVRWPCSLGRSADAKQDPKLLP